MRAWLFTFIFTLLNILLIIQSISAQNYVSGSTSGVLGPGIYIVIGDIQVPSGQVLTILPGTEFRHRGNYAWIIDGSLHAEGSKTDSIYFTRENPIAEHRWKGIRFQQGTVDGSVLNYCVIDHCYVNSGWFPPYLYGGGIYSYKAAIIVKNTRISNCEAAWHGGGIYAFNADILVDSCQIVNNTAILGANGGGIYLYNCPAPRIMNSVIAGNSATGTAGYCGGGGLRLANSNATISHCQIYDNTAIFFGAGVLVHDSTPMFINNTITSNYCTSSSIYAKGGGLYASSSSRIIGTNNIVFFNDATYYPETYGDIAFNYTCCSTQLEGTGNIVNNPLFVNPRLHDYHLQETSPCIDAGNPSSQPDPDATIADMGALFFDQREPEIALSDSMVIFLDTVIGETSYADLIIYNQGTRDLVIYEMANIQQNIFQTSWNWQNSTIPPGDSLMVELYFSPQVTTTYGDILEIENNDTLQLVYLYGTGTQPTSAVNGKNGKTPLDFTLKPAFPNPFNPQTKLSYAIPHASEVSLSIYDHLGQRLAVLVDRVQEAGNYEVAFNASHLSSGVYFALLQAGDFRQTQKLLLLK